MTLESGLPASNWADGWRISPRATHGGVTSEPLSGRDYAPKHDASGILTFYMGKNTPERKDFIMGNLVVAVEA